MSNFIMEFDDLLLTIERAGGKAFSLARLLRGKIAVPDGFVVTTDAYKRFVEDNDIRERILEIYSRLDLHQVEKQREAAESIAHLFSAGIFADDLRQELLAGYAMLNCEALAVRSSATAEDLPSASFAGLQDSFLNIRGEQNYLDAVRRTWASLWTQRAISYRQRHAIAPEGVAMAVVVQQMVPALASGVFFSVNPTNGERNQMLITSGWGLGEAIVSSGITPDTITMQKEPLKILQTKIVEKPSLITADPMGGTHEQPVEKKLRRATSLNPLDAIEVAIVGLSIEKMFGCPVDVEWVLTPAGLRNKIEIVQARPITNLPAQSPRWQTPQPGLWLSRESLAEQIPNPVTPLFGTLGLRVINLATKELGRQALGTEGESYQYYSINGYVYLATKMNLFSMPRIATTAIVKMWGSFIESHTVWQHALEDLKTFLSLYDHKELNRLSDSELLDGARNMMWATAQYYTRLQPSTLPSAMLSEVVFRFWYNLLKNKNDPPASQLLFGLDTLVLRSEKKLFEIATWAQKTDELATYLAHQADEQIARDLLSKHFTPPACSSQIWREFVGQMEEYFEDFGYTSFNFDFSHATPAEMPGIEFGLIKGYLSGSARNPSEWQQQCTETRARVMAEIEHDFKLLPITWLERSLNWAMRSVADKEDSLSDLFLAYPLVRLYLLELGSRFVANGVLSESRDIFWLQEDEIVDLMARQQAGEVCPDFHQIIVLRKDEWLSDLRLHPPLMIPQASWMKWYKPFARAAAPPAHVLQGDGVSAGEYTGVARVLFTPAEFPLLKQGEVLVAVTTTPAWTPLFNKAGAIVTDIGGALSHSSIIAREYGIPAVVATGCGTRTILSGQLVTVNGSTGEVVLADGTLNSEQKS